MSKLIVLIFPAFLLAFLFPPYLATFGQLNGMDYHTKTVGAFGSIQQAIDTANTGDTIIVPSGVYYEHILIEKSISLVGENMSNTIVDGSNGGTVVKIAANDVLITGLTIRYSGWGWTNNGVLVQNANRCRILNNYFFINCHNIRLNYSSNSLIANNTIEGNGYGIRLLHSQNCTAIDNNVSGCIGGIHLEYSFNCTVKTNYLTENDQGLRIYSPSVYNRLYENTVFNNTYDGMIDNSMNFNSTLQGNMIYHNNFVNDTYSFIIRGSGIKWDKDYPSGGNYWSRYNGSDNYKGAHQSNEGSDGIGDTYYIIDAVNADRFPLTHYWNSDPVHNVNTGIAYHSIQEAINSPDTVANHTIYVQSGIYREHVVLNKSLQLIGEDRSSIIDGENQGTILTILSNRSSISGLTIQNGGSNYPPYGNDCGIIFDHCSLNNLTDSYVTHTRLAISIYYASNNTLYRNYVASNYENGIWLWHSPFNTLYDNKMTNNSYSFGVFGVESQHFNNLVGTDNIVDGKYVKYVLNPINEAFDDPNIGTLYVINGYNVTIANLSTSRNCHGVFVFNSSNVRIENISAFDCNYGAYLENSINSLIEKSDFDGNWVSISIQSSRNVKANGNSIFGGEKGVSLYDADNCTIEGNTIKNVTFGVRLFDANQNRIYHNNLISNEVEADVLNSYQNVWDNGIEGNFWDGYSALNDNKNGIGDTARSIDAENSDRFPLLGSFYSFIINGADRIEIVTNSSLLGLNYVNSNGTIMIYVSGSDGTNGFCRIKIPRNIMDQNISIVIDNGESKTLYENLDLLRTEASVWIYFTYTHSSHKIIIIPELSTFLMCAFLSALSTLTIYRARKIHSFLG